MRNTLFLLATLSIILVNSGCMGSRLTQQLKWHNSELKRAAESNMDPGKKLDILLESVAKMMEESIEPLSPKKSVKYVQKYVRQNEGYIAIILKDVGKWQDKMSPFQTIQYGLSIQNKPFVQTFVQSLPKYKKKYKQYAFAIGLVDDVTAVLIKFGNKALGI
ncbi:MAG: hypothetical protein KDC24_10550 [Saprospiraceae bacterium]|nr:hypothetical protein [Saprospiraceae bacterium]